MRKCGHTYKQHESGLAAFCRANPDRWYPITLIGCLGVIAVLFFGFFTLMWTLFL